MISELSARIMQKAATSFAGNRPVYFTAYGVRTRVFADTDGLVYTARRIDGDTRFVDMLPHEYMLHVYRERDRLCLD